MASRLVCFLLLFAFSVSGFGQKKKTETVKHEQEVRQMVDFLEFMLNTLGSRDTPNRDKDVVINESFLKIFRDAKVQVEDDLDDERKVITNKNIQAYLKDVDFFFDDVTFDFTIDRIEARGNVGDELIYRVALSRVLKGTNLDGKAVNNASPRYIEVNFHTATEDLKIVSMYTREFDQTATLKAWWSSLSYEWQSIFRRKLNLFDSVQVRDIRRMVAIDTLELSGNEFITDLQPLTELLDLRKLDLSGTAIVDLTPIRNLSSLSILNISATKVRDLTPLKHATAIRHLNLSECPIDSITVLERLGGLRSLDLRRTGVKDFRPLSSLKLLESLYLSQTDFKNTADLDSLENLVTLDLSKTKTVDLKGLQSLAKLQVLNLDSIFFADSSPLRHLNSLRVLQLNHTSLGSLDDFLGLKALQRIYCDNSRINQAVADQFSKKRSDVLVIFESDDLRGWWSDLSPVWRDVLSRRARISLKPGKEDLAAITNIDSINISNYRTIKDLEPLRRMKKLEVVIASQTGISSVQPLQAVLLLRSLDISGTGITDITPLAGSKNLRFLQADQTQIDGIDTLKQLSLERIYADGSNITDDEVKALLNHNPRCLVVYRTAALEQWWEALSDPWKQALQLQINVNTKPTRQNFHRLTQQEKIEVKDIAVTDLDALNVFLRLRELSLHGTLINDPSPLKDHHLVMLHITSSPLRSVSPLSSLRDLTDLKISDTPVEEIEGLSALVNLTKLDCSGTKIRKLKPLANLRQLLYLDLSNTDVRSLKDIEHLSLRTLKCFNTKIPPSQVSSYRERNPDCQVTYYR